jgi:tRNA A-37 threonylcarbamoyl transferase component Bud32
MKQGNNSNVEKINNRLHKTINNNLKPFEECKILKSVSTLGPEFPQNVECEGVYKLSYDYIEGMTLHKYIKTFIKNNIKQPYENQVIIFKQLLLINKKLLNVGIMLCDQVLSNFILDNNGVIHVIDFGYVEIDDVIEENDKIRCLTRAVNNWYKNGLIDEELYNMYFEYDLKTLINKI